MLPIAAAVALMIAGQALQSRALAKAEDKKAASMQRMRRVSKEAEDKKAALNDRVAALFDPANRTAAEGEAQEAATSDLTQYLDSARGALMAGTDKNYGSVSDAYQADRGKRAANELDYARKLALLMGRLKGRETAGLQQGYALGDVASQRDVLGSMTRSQIQPEQAYYQNIQPNSTMMALGSLASMAGTAMLGGQMGGLGAAGSGAGTTAGTAAGGMSPAMVSSTRFPWGKLMGLSGPMSPTSIL